MSAGVIICGGPEPRTQAACYGGCYEWCITSGWCDVAEGDLTPKQRRTIRRFQKRSGGIFPNDLREASDWGLSGAQSRMLADLESLATASPRNRTANALEARGLVEWWGDDLYDMYNKGKPGHWHLMGEGADFILKATGVEPGLCRCVTRPREGTA